VATKPPKAPPLDSALVVRQITRSPWDSREVKKYRQATLWCTRFGFYFTVPNDCTQADLEAIMEDLRKYGRKRNV